jgi:peptide/nickel transport system substrate-binding protein
MKATRRTVMGGSLAIAGLASAPGILRAQARPPAARTVRAVMHGDIPTYDPIWTTANMSAYHGGMVYDMLLGADARGDEPRPQMVRRWGISDDKLTYTFELRDGLRFSDNTEVTSADVVPSIRRWMVRSGSGQLLAQHTRDISAKDAKTFSVVLKEPFSLLLDIFSSTNTPVLFIMRKREAETDPMQKIDQVVGSGPYILNQDETKVGSQYVYDKNPHYVPRSEPASGTAGGKVVKVDRTVYVNMPDSQTAVAALQAGEIDFYEIPPIDLLDQLQSDPAITIENLFDLGLVGHVGLNWLHPPFNNIKCRQAVLHIMNQEDMLRPTFVSPKWYKTCGSYFTCGSAMENDANTGWFKSGPNIPLAKQLLAEGGYDGKPIVMLQATNIPYMSNAATVMAEQLRGAGMKVDLQPMDWAGVVARRVSQAPSDQGGWDIFFTSGAGPSYSDPYTDVSMATNGTKGWFGWPSDEKNEQLRAAWVAAETLEQRKAIAAQIQDNAWNIVPHLHFGQWQQPTAHRKNVTGWLHVPDLIPFWNVEKT